ncbi:hypothetical protein C7431_11174 [Pantoea allii]|uniref:Uncharacterized protein n=1 Tax=Pantoea allii TaxID=574096 RepID=A0A2V2B531_9GAMM|nr:hypothetical protein [Pantoea allii]PWK94337.1 hypothetical protein C7431_11174 [Pantoea allii]
MLLISPVWQARLTAVQRFGKVTLQTFVLWPALLFFFLFLLSADKAGSGGKLLLTWAEEAVRGAPAGQAWGCQVQHVSQNLTARSASDTAWHRTALPQPPKAEPCVKAAVNRDVWIEETNGSLREFYETCVLISAFASFSAWYLRSRAKRGK